MSEKTAWYAKPKKNGLVRKIFGCCVPFRAGPERPESSSFLSKNDQKHGLVRKTHEKRPGTQKYRRLHGIMAPPEIALGTAWYALQPATLRSHLTVAKYFKIYTYYRCEVLFCFCFVPQTTSGKF